MNNKTSQFMIKNQLQNEFNRDQLQNITSVPPTYWQSCQKELLKMLYQNQHMYQKYFQIFEANHIKLAHWYYLATRNKHKIEPYLFRELLQNRKTKNPNLQGFSNEKLKSAFSTETNMQKTSKQNTNMSLNKDYFEEESQFRESQSILPCKNETQYPQKTPLRSTFTRLKSKKKTNFRIQQQKFAINSSKTDKLAVYLNKSVLLDEKTHKNSVQGLPRCASHTKVLKKRKVVNLKQHDNLDKHLFRNKENTENQHDAHQLYIKTFQACSGRNYIFYDYEKHMKGLKNRKNYNQFLRREESFVQTDENQLPFKKLKETKALEKYQQFQKERQKIRQKQRCSLFPVNLLLRDKKFNNYQGLRKVVQDNRSSKLVFVNHLGKPITYYIKKKAKNFPSSQSNKSNENRHSLELSCIKAQQEALSSHEALCNDSITTAR